MDAARRRGLVAAAVAGSYVTFSDRFAIPEPRFDGALDPSADLGAVDPRAHVRRCTVLVAIGHDRHHAVVEEGGAARVAAASPFRGTKCDHAAAKLRQTHTTRLRTSGDRY
jgi:hypothetical protein